MLSPDSAVNFYFGCAANASVDLQVMRSKIARDAV